jgi:hypothetical protein
MSVSTSGGARRPAALALLLAAGALTGMPGCMSNCAAECHSSFSVAFERPISADGTWTFEARIGERGQRCTVVLPDTTADCGVEGSASLSLDVGTHDGELAWLELWGIGDASRAGQLRLTIEHDEELVLGLGLWPAYEDFELCGKSCFRAETSVWF